MSTYYIDICVYLFLYTVVNILLNAILTQVYVGLMLLHLTIFISAHYLHPCLTESMIKGSIWNHIFVFSDVYIQCFYFNIISDTCSTLLHQVAWDLLRLWFIWIHHLPKRIVYDDLKPFFGFLPQSHAIQISSRRVKRFISWTILKCNWTVERINGWIPEEGSIQGEWCMGCEFLKQ